MSRAIVFCLVLLTLSCLAVQPLPAVDEGPVKVGPATEQALLASDWQAVAERCGTIGEKTAAPVRAVKGHACLALNQNDHSLRLFLSLASDPERQQWRAWAVEFRRRVEALPGATAGNQALARYFEGDSLARLGNWGEAAARFQEATVLDGRCVLAWNALGVARSLQKEPDLAQAQECFERACHIDGKFADAHANAGTLGLVLEGAPAAVEQFERAIACSQGFSLAHNGLACALLGKSRQPASMEAAEREFAAAMQCEAVSPLVQQSVKKLLQQDAEETPEQGGSAPGRTAGFHANVELNKLTNQMRNSPPTQWKQQITNCQKTHTPQEFKQVADLANTRARWQDFGGKLLPKTSVTSTTTARGGAGGVGVVGPGIVGGGIAAKTTIKTTTTVDPGRLLREAAHINSTVARAAPPVFQTGPGGADVRAELQESSGDIGPWPTKTTWFGLAPGIALPPTPSY